ncbi:MAG: hypothetical protein J0652_12490 [Desulfobulbaceae bacterium]|nr:hypothetical protein [Desulfobulbaceae bacterium]
MRPKILPLLSLLLLLPAIPHPAHAFWGTEEGTHVALDLESGYDINTVTTVNGRILSVQTGIERRNVQLEIEESGGARMMVVLGPQRYLADQKVSLQAGEDVVVRGSKAQGKDGVIYILAREITESSTEATIVLRDEGGFPKWAGGNLEKGNGSGVGRGSGSGSGFGVGPGRGHGGGRGR